LENFDHILVRVSVSEDIALSFFISGLNIEFETFVGLHKPSTIQETVSLVRLRDEGLQGITKRLNGSGNTNLEYQWLNIFL